MTVFNLKMDLEKWIHQNNAHYTGNFFYGALLDNFILECNRGYAFVYERYVNANSSTYEITFIPYKETKEIDKHFAEFIEIERKVNSDIA